MSIYNIYTNIYSLSPTLNMHHCLNSSSITAEGQMPTSGVSNLQIFPFPPYPSFSEHEDKALIIGLVLSPKKWRLKTIINPLAYKTMP